MYLKEFLINHRDEFVSLCRVHGVDKMHAFGSAVTDHFDPAKSDIDLLVSTGIEDPAERGESLLSLWDDLESFFGRKVDLVTENSLRNPFLRASIERSKFLIYDRMREEVSV